MTGYDWLVWLHIVAVSTWPGGLIVLAFLVMALRKAGADRDMLRVVARQFGRVSWVAMALAIVTGLAQMHVRQLPYGYRPLVIKLVLVGLLIAVAFGHQLTARKSSPAVRGVLQLVIILLTLAVVRVAVYVF